MLTSSSSLQGYQISLIHYKNCIFHGVLIDSLKQHTGLLFLDNGQVIISQFKNDQLHGQCIIFLDYQTYVIGNFIRNILDGQFVIRNSKMTIYVNIKMNKIHGQIVVINWQDMMGRMWMIQDSQGVCTRQLQLNPLSSQEQILLQLSPLTSCSPSSLQFLQQKFSSYLSINTSSLSHTTQICFHCESFHKIKLYLFNDKLMEYGVYHDDMLNDLGFMMEGGVIYQGKFKNGKLYGDGVKVDINQDKIIYGTFNNGDIRSVDIITDDYKLVKQQIKKYKKQVHMHSLQFYNNYFNQRPIMLLSNLLKTIKLNQINYNQQIYHRQQQSQIWKNKSYDIKKQQNYQTQKKYMSNLSTLRKNHQNHQKQQKQQKQQKESENLIKNMLANSNFVSRFKINNHNSNSNENNNNQFQQGIKEYQQINKALRKFK